MITPKISVIVPIYNDELYLTDTLQSIRNQTYTEFECICVNDGSVDNTEEIIDRFVQQDKRFKKVNQTNQGVSVARNTGMGIARGEFLFFLDHDDLILPDALYTLLSAAEKCNADMSRGRMMMIEENFMLTELPQQHELKQQLHFFEDPLTDFYRHIRRRYKNWRYIWQCLFRRSVLRNIRFVESLRSGKEDNLFIYEVVANIKNFVQTESIVTCHRRSKTSVMLNGFKPVHIKMFDTLIPYVYQKYAIAETIDKRLLWWVYHKESYSVFRVLVRNAIRSNQQDFILLAHGMLLKYKNTPEFAEIANRWSFRQKVLFWLFGHEHFKVLRFIRVFL